MTEKKTGAGARPQDMRQKNRRMLLQLLIQAEDRTVNELAAQMNLSRTAVQNILMGLMEKGIVRAGEKRASTLAGGKRAVSYAICPDYRYGISLSLGAEYAVAELHDFCLSRVDYRIAGVLGSPYEQVIRQAAMLIRQLVEQAGLKKEKLFGISVAISGTVDSEKGILLDLTGSNASGKWGKNLPLARDLRAALDFSGPVYVDNLCSFSGYACSCREPFVRSRSILYILAHNRGIGAAFVRDGKMSRGLMGEIGHTTVDFACTERCRCGRTGCFEAMLYPSAIRQRVQRALESGTPSSLHPENLSSIDDLFRQADRGDAAARQETDRIAGLFASLLCNAQIMMDPQDILFHDAYGYSCEYFHRRMEEICREKTDGSFFAPPRIHFIQEDFTESVRYGAVSYSRDAYLHHFVQEE